MGLLGALCIWIDMFRGLYSHSLSRQQTNQTQQDKTQDNIIPFNMNSPPPRYHPTPTLKRRRRRRMIPFMWTRSYAAVVLVVVVQLWMFDGSGLCVQAAIPNAELEIWEEKESSTSTSTSTSTTPTQMLITRTSDFGHSNPVRGILRIPQKDDPQQKDLYFCNVTTTTTTTTTEQQPPPLSYTADDILLVPRGQCTFAQKTRVAAMWGAGGIVIYNTLESRYAWNDNDEQVVYPTSKQDYECDESWGGGHVWIDSSRMPPLDPPRYETSIHDSYLTMGHPDNVCTLSSESCPSQRCLMTGSPPVSPLEDYEGLQYQVQACCAWDILVNMKGDDDDSTTTTIPHMAAMFVTMAQSDILLTLEGSTIQIQMRETPWFNIASLLLFILGTGIVLGASLYSTKDYVEAKQRITLHFDGLQRQHYDYPSQEPPPQDDENGTTSTTSTHHHRDNHTCESPRQQSPLQVNDNDEIITVPCVTDEQEGEEEGLQLTNRNRISSSTSSPPSISNENNPTTTTTTTITSNYNDNNNNNDNTTTLPPPIPPQVNNPTTTLDLTVWHALGFVIMASSTLLLLFYFEFYDFVTVVYGFACCTGSTKLVFLPLYQKLGQWVMGEGSTTQCCLGATPSILFPPHSRIVRGRVGCGCCKDLTWGVLGATLSGFAWGITWLYVGFTAYQPASQNPFYWISQNIFGAIVCIDFLSIIRLNSIKVATALLVVAFVYDIFFVFLTPLFLESGESVMVTVATGGGGGGNSGESTSADYCEKYPGDSSHCRGNNVLPMVLTIPRLHDYRGGSSLLGLGDILLPGLLIAFGARLDAAKRLSSTIGLGREEGEVSSSPHKWWYQGYLCPLIVAYAVGLMAASLAVYWMERGQPALLYIIPTTLGTMVLLGHYQWGELGNLWKGPPELKWADNLVRYSRTLTSSTYQVYAHQALQLLNSQQSQSQPSPQEQRSSSPNNQGDGSTGTVEQAAPLSNVEMSTVTTPTIPNHNNCNTHEESPAALVIT